MDPSLPTPAPDRRRTYLHVAILLLLVAVAYLPAMRAGFIWDDDDYVVHNPLLTEEGGLAEIWNPFSDRNPQYYPLVFTSFLVERSLYGTHPAGYHLVNIALHGAIAVLLLLLLRRLGYRPALFAAALFAVHPVHVESVAWVTERKNVLSAFFYLLSFLAYLRFDRCGKLGSYGISLLCFALALLSKTVTASLPIAIGLALWWSGRRPAMRHYATLAPMLLIGFVSGLLTRAYEAKHVLGEVDAFAHLGPAERWVNAGRALWFYPSKIVWPFELAFFYERWSVDAASPAAWLPLLAALALLLGLGWSTWKGAVGRGALAAAAFYAVTIFPALGFVDIAPLRLSPVADHFQYLASIGTLLLVAALLHRLLPGSARLRVAGATLLLLALVTLSYRQAGHFRDPGRLWSHTVALSPQNPMALVSYGSWLRSERRHDEAAEQFERAIEAPAANTEERLVALTNLANVRLAQGRFEEALRSVREAEGIKADHPFVLRVKGWTLWRAGRHDEAERALESYLGMPAASLTTESGWQSWLESHNRLPGWIRSRFNDATALNVLGHIRRERGSPDEAERLYRRAIELDARELAPYLSLEALYTGRRRFDEAEAVMLEAVGLHPDSAVALVQLARPLAAKGETQRALELLERALAIAPEDAAAHRQRIDLLRSRGRHREAIQGLRAARARGIGGRPFTLRLIWELSTAPSAEDRDGSEAVRLSREILAEGGAGPGELSIIAAAQAEAGEFAAALETVRRAMAQGQDNVSMLSRLREQRLDYEAGRPTRSP